MVVIRSKTPLYASCMGSFLCCSPEAAKLVGIGGALILNNLICCAQEPNIGKLTAKNGDIYYPLTSAISVNDLSELIDPLVVTSLIENLCEEKLIKVKKIENALYYKILYSKE